MRPHATPLVTPSVKAAQASEKRFRILMDGQSVGKSTSRREGDLETITFPGGTDGITLRGNVSVIPEPTTALLFALGLGGLASIRRRE